MKINSNKIKSLFLMSLVGSGIGKENNQTEINLNSLPQLAANSTNAKITEESPVQNVLNAGLQISRNTSAPSGIYTVFCTSGFVVINSNITCNYPNSWDYGGFLVSLNCWPSTAYASNPNVYSGDGSVLLGDVVYITNGLANIDLLYVSANLANVKLLPFVPKITDEGTVDLLPVISSSNPTAPGLRVCVYGAASGYQCGNLIELDLSLTILDPAGLYSITFDHLNKVDLGTGGVEGIDEDDDVGAPVYTETQIGDRTLAEALGQVTTIDYSDPNHHYLYYTPIDKALSLISMTSGCDYSLLTYNETNAQEYDQLLAQVEIPTKK